MRGNRSNRRQSARVTVTWRYDVEIFVDFGLFELLAVSGIVMLARAIHRRPLTRRIVLALSVLAPAAVVLLVSDQTVRWIAAVALGTSALNTSFIVTMNRQSAEK
jgi:hypothetical protein